MRILIIFSLVLIASHSVATRAQLPDLSKKEDLKALGVGRIVEKDRSILKNITLHEVKEYWVVYIKNGSIHDLLMEKIDRIEFRDTKWGAVKIEFHGGIPKISNYPITINVMKTLLSLTLFLMSISFLSARGMELRRLIHKVLLKGQNKRQPHEIVHSKTNETQCSPFCPAIFYSDRICPAIC